MNLSPIRAGRWLALAPLLALAGGMVGQLAARLVQTGV